MESKKTIYAQKMREIIREKNQTFGNYLYPPAFESMLEVGEEPNVFGPEPSGMDYTYLRVDFRHAYSALFDAENHELIRMNAVWLDDRNPKLTELYRNPKYCA